jgi:hypothetical protein
LQFSKKADGIEHGTSCTSCTLSKNQTPRPTSQEQQLACEIEFSFTCTQGQKKRRKCNLKDGWTGLNGTGNHTPWKLESRRGLGQLVCWRHKLGQCSRNWSVQSDFRCLVKFCLYIKGKQSLGFNSIFGS